MDQKNEVAEVRQLLETVVRLLGAQVAPNLTMSERAPLLASLGLDRNAIAAICRTNPAVISARLSEAKQRGTKPKNGKKRAQSAAATPAVAVGASADVQPEEL